MVNLQFFAKRPDCTVFYCLSLDLWLKILIVICVLAIIGLVAFVIFWFCRKRRMCKGKKQVQTELSEKGKEGNSDYNGYCDYSGNRTQGSCAEPKVTYDGGSYV